MSRGLLFLCVANSARSQMAEGIASRLGGHRMRVQSAGSAPTRTHPLAIRALAEIGIDISGSRSKSIEEIDPGTVHTVITLCAEELCPAYLRTARRLHWPVQDPVSRGESQEENLERFREVRDELRRRIGQWLAEEALEGQDGDRP